MTDKQKEKKKLSGTQLRTIIVASISAVLGLVLIITNFFVPVKYLFSYTVVRNKGAEDGTMRVRFVDVGYGDCTIVELPDGKNMLIDAGDGRTSNQAKILKYLNKCDINTIDYLICTSVNSEHCGGLAEILQYKTVKKVYSPYCTDMFVTDEYYKFMYRLGTLSTVNKICEYGVGEDNSEYGYFFKFLSPSVHTLDVGEYAELNKNPNSYAARYNASAVLWLRYGETSFLFTSDAGSETLSALCNSITPDEAVDIKNCNVVQVANHGGDVSACQDFYDYINAEMAVISVGKNSGASPSLEVISDLKDIKVYRTDTDKTVTVEVTKEGYKVV